MHLRRILTLDLATTTGFAIGDMGEPPICGAFRASPPGSSIGFTLVRFADWLEEIIAENRPYAICYEAPVMIFGKTNRSTTDVLRGLIAITEERATRREIPFVAEVNVSDWRTFLFGKGGIKRGTPSKKIKEMTIAHVRALGFDPPDDNAADALAIWLYMQELFRQVDEKRAAVRGAGQ